MRYVLDSFCVSYIIIIKIIIKLFVDDTRSGERHMRVGVFLHIITIGSKSASFQSPCTVSLGPRCK